MRIVQVAAGLAACALVGLAGYVLPTRTSIAAIRMQDPGSKEEDAPQPQRAKLVPYDRPRKLPASSDESPPEAKTTLPEPEPAAQPSSIAPDPEKDADDFVARTRKEAAERVAALDKESKSLRTRLAKVEAASAKLKAAFGTVGEPVLAPAVPGTRLGERQPPRRDEGREFLPPPDFLQNKDGSLTPLPSRESPPAEPRPKVNPPQPRSVRA